MEGSVEVDTWHEMELGGMDMVALEILQLVGKVRTGSVLVEAMIV